MNARQRRSRAVSPWESYIFCGNPVNSQPRREKGNLIAPASLDESGKPAEFSAMERQMRATYANAVKLLARFGASLDNVVEETLYVLDVDSAFAVAGKVRKEAYGTARPQCASNLIGVARLAFPEQLIEIAFKAVLSGAEAKPQR
jgi:enamine deaminase RidA (YjgF/YER057c/UK114 family)